MAEWEEMEDAGEEGVDGEEGYEDCGDDGRDNDAADDSVMDAAKGEIGDGSWKTGPEASTGGSVFEVRGCSSNRIRAERFNGGD
ncbi:MAG: hypothetical protein Q9212_007337 [Teloschistes hypoglaucus]